jgi:hypothetical protein
LLLSPLASSLSDETLGISTFGVDWQNRACSTGPFSPPKVERACVVELNAVTKAAWSLVDCMCR